MQIMLWFIPPGKELPPKEVLTESKTIMKLMTEKENFDFQFRHYEQLWKQRLLHLYSILINFFFNNSSFPHFLHNTEHISEG